MALKCLTCIALRKCYGLVQEKGDSFDLMVESESRIRLGEEGWKGRYYQVAPARQLPPCRIADSLAGNCWPRKPAAI
jgi:hypothetical protein